MSILTAVETVLTEVGEPLHYKEITKRLLNQGLWTTTGQTPDATVNAQLAVDIKRRGEASKFRRTDKGVFALRAWAPTNPQPSPHTPAPPTHLSFTDAAEKVLDKYTDKSPMHYRAITDKAPYWQFFCGRTFFEHELPCHPTSLVKWRHRLGAAGVEKLLTETLSTAKREQALRDSEIKRVHVDTTVQEKAVAFPTDARLYHKARRALVRAAQAADIPLRQTYVRLGKQALAQQGRYAQARQMKRARRETKRLRQYLGRVIRDIRRQCPRPAPTLKLLLERSERIFRQQRHDTRKVYSVHAPEVECIAKGKAHKPYEFGCKVAVVTTSKSSWVVGIEAVHENPYDGATLSPALKQVERTTEVRPVAAFVDRGFKGAAHHPEGVAVYVSGRKRLTRTLKALLRQRSAIEPVIGHLKGEHKLGRNHLLGQGGDRINALLTGCGFNLRKLWRFFQAAASLQPA